MRKGEMTVSVEFGDSRMPPRFWKRIRVSADGCWIWTGAQRAAGYGGYWDGTKATAVHLAAYKALVGPPPDQTLDHLCRNRRCANPSHLEPVSNKENVLRGVGPTAINSRKTHCVRGHALAGENIWVVRRHGEVVGRACLECRRTQGRLRARKRYWGEPKPEIPADPSKQHFQKRGKA
jgi:hypothetical protein